MENEDLKQRVSQFRENKLRDWKVETLAELEEEKAQIQFNADKKIAKLEAFMKEVENAKFIKRGENECRSW